MDPRFDKYIGRDFVADHLPRSGQQVWRGLFLAHHILQHEFGAPKSIQFADFTGRQGHLQQRVGFWQGIRRFTTTIWESAQEPGQNDERTVDLADLAVGDLVLLARGPRRRGLGVYAGDGMVVHALMDHIIRADDITRPGIGRFVRGIYRPTNAFMTAESP